jgi:hypothetical protein
MKKLFTLFALMAFAALAQAQEPKSATFQTSDHI